MQNPLIGADVVVVDNGETYSSYEGLLRKNNISDALMAKWVSKTTPENGATGKVVAVLREGDLPILLIEVKNQVFIISQKAVLFVSSELTQLRKFKACWDELYGKGLKIANWHQNGQLEDFDNFYDSAMDEYHDEDHTEYVNGCECSYCRKASKGL